MKYIPERGNLRQGRYQQRLGAVVLVLVRPTSSGHQQHWRRCCRCRARPDYSVGPWVYWGVNSRKLRRIAWLVSGLFGLVSDGVSDRDGPVLVTVPMTWRATGARGGCAGTAGHGRVCAAGAGARDAGSSPNIPGIHHGTGRMIWETSPFRDSFRQIEGKTLPKMKSLPDHEPFTR